MFRYKIGYWTHEGDFHWDLVHHEEYCEGQIVEFMATAVVEAYDEYGKHGETPPCVVGDIIGDLYFKEALMRVGFTESECAQTVSTYGWASTKPDSPDASGYAESKIATRAIKTRLFHHINSLT